MSDRDAPAPDRVVETALRLLPVPDHEPGFWERLDARLAAEPAPTAAAPTRAAAPVEAGAAGSDAAPVPVVPLEPADLSVIPSAMRRPSNVVLSVLAVAAAVVVVVAASALVRSRTGGDQPADEVAGPAATEPGDPEAPGAPDEPADPQPSALAAPAGSPETQVVVDWVRALAAGDVDAAWALLGPGSQAHWGSRDAFAAQRTDFAEGYGAWAGTSAEQVLVTPLVDGSLSVVTLVGPVEQEGARNVRADAFPVRRVDGGLRLELYASAGPVEVVVPGAPVDDGTPATVAPGEELVVVVPEGARPPVLRIDDGTVVTCGQDAGTFGALEGSPGQRCGYRPPTLTAGDHVLTVAVWRGDGAEVTAHSVRFRVR